MILVSITRYFIIQETGLAFASRKKMETGLAPYGARLRRNAMRLRFSSFQVPMSILKISPSKKLGLLLTGDGT